jgi:hypothetical protein
MSGKISQIFSDKIIRLSSIFTIALLLALTALSVYYFFKLPPFIPLYNQLPWGVERLSESIGIFLPLAISVGFFVINLIVSSKTYEKMPLLSRILSITSLLISLLTFIFIARTVQLVI